ncbi:hypothetical protein SADUNF_Sadunf17G0062600 [Salix dunnii]|uniref:Mon2 C-terminal domain-containing protein n=1 Tax=Salix dunnii TaxID=1413687 RepID=A0A835MJU1_9ROSI|nr:hypothetical protein SADUNF_Sadunf17G0062600 [Salix dunnii]
MVLEECKAERVPLQSLLVNFSGNSISVPDDATRNDKVSRKSLLLLQGLNGARLVIPKMKRRRRMFGIFFNNNVFLSLSTKMDDTKLSISVTVENANCESIAKKEISSAALVLDESMDSLFYDANEDKESSFRNDRKVGRQENFTANLMANLNTACSDDHAVALDPTYEEGTRENFTKNLLANLISSCSDDYAATDVLEVKNLHESLASLSELSFDPRPEIRKSALQVLFETVRNHGHLFSLPLWERVFESVLFPIFDYVRHAIDPTGGDPPEQGIDGDSGELDQDAWLYETCTLALQLVVDLFVKFYNTANPLLKKVLLLLKNREKREECGYKDNGDKKNREKREECGYKDNGDLVMKIWILK